MAPEDLSVLVIDDEKVSRLVLERFLKKAHYGGTGHPLLRFLTIRLEVVCVDSATAALQLLDAGKGKVDLILADVTMPKMNGLEFLQHLKERHEQDGSEIPPVVSSCSFFFMPTFSFNLLIDSGVGCRGSPSRVSVSAWGRV